MNNAAGNMGVQAPGEGGVVVWFFVFLFLTVVFFVFLLLCFGVLFLGVFFCFFGFFFCFLLCWGLVAACGI